MCLSNRLIPLSNFRTVLSKSLAGGRGRRCVDLGFARLVGGERGIRTLGTFARTTVFETATFNHSATSPQKKLV